MDELGNAKEWRPRPELNRRPNVLIFLVVLREGCACTRDRTRYLKCIKQVPLRDAAFVGSAVAK